MGCALADAEDSCGLVVSGQAYPTPSEMDCGEIPHWRFRVVGANLYPFDGDHAGIGCEK
jgi:hypothetical protein